MKIKTLENYKNKPIRSLTHYLLEEIIFGANTIPMDFDYIDSFTDQPFSHDLKLTCHIPLEQEEPRTPEIILGKLQKVFTWHMYAPAEKNSEVSYVPEERDPEVSYERFQTVNFDEYLISLSKKDKPKNPDPYGLT